MIPKIKEIQGIERTNSYVAVATIDRNNNMVFKNEDGKLLSVTDITGISEHDERIDNLSMHCKFIIDTQEHTIRNGGVPYKYTYVIDENHTGQSLPMDGSQYCTRNSKRNLTEIMRNHEIYKKDPLFFAGSSDFLKEILPYLDTIYLMVVDTDLSEQYEVVDKFPIEEFEKYFPRERQTILSDKAEKIKLNEKVRRPHQEIEILNNHFKLVKRVDDRQKKGPTDYYRFFTFRR